MYQVINLFNFQGREIKEPRKREIFKISFRQTSIINDKKSFELSSVKFFMYPWSVYDEYLYFPPFMNMKFEWKDGFYHQLHQSTDHLLTYEYEEKDRKNSMKCFYKHPTMIWYSNLTNEYLPTSYTRYTCMIALKYIYSITKCSCYPDKTLLPFIYTKFYPKDICNSTIYEQRQCSIDLDQLNDADLIDWYLENASRIGLGNARYICPHDCLVRKLKVIHSHEEKNNDELISLTIKPNNLKIIRTSIDDIHRRKDLWEKILNILFIFLGLCMTDFFEVLELMYNIFYNIRAIVWAMNNYINTLVYRFIKQIDVEGDDDLDGDEEDQSFDSDQ